MFESSVLSLPSKLPFAMKYIFILSMHLLHWEGCWLPLQEQGEK